MAEVEILDKTCLKFDSKEVCNEKFREMNEAVINSMTDTRKEFNAKKEEYKKKIKEGFEVARELSGYKEIEVKPFISYIRNRLGGVGWRTLRGETARDRLTELDIPAISEEKRKLMTPEEWEETKRKATEWWKE